MPFWRRRFGDVVSVMDVSAMDFRSTLLLPNFWTCPQCQPCSIALGKFLLLVFMAKVAKKTCQTSKEKLTWHLSLSMWVGVCLWANSGIPLRQTRVRVRPEAIFGTSLLEQEFAFRKATVGKGLEVRINSHTERQPTERKNENTLKLAVKCNLNNYAKAEALIAVLA